MVADVVVFMATIMLWAADKAKRGAFTACWEAWNSVSGYAVVPGSRRAIACMLRKERQNG